MIALRSLEENGFNFEDHDHLIEALDVPSELVNTFGRRATLRSQLKEQKNSLFKQAKEGWQRGDSIMDGRKALQFKSGRFE